VEGCQIRQKPIDAGHL